ncbi:DUF2690 domain-containing protein [Streptomyces sp. NPDC059340]|uniref:DUF2690 domain-containing protein n=1 Tax=Streptomyces sp. NPDC059340 TaxID=3346806 RepID=UPI0036927830
MKSSTKSKLSVAVTAAALVAGGLLGAPAASAATSCLGSTCNGLNPANTTCQNDARTVQDGAFRGVELRYSPSCRAAWGRFPNAPKGSKLEIKNNQGKKYTTNGPSGGGTFFSVMINDKDVTAWACAYWDSNTQSECTGAY